MKNSGFLMLVVFGVTLVLFLSGCASISTPVPIGPPQATVPQQPTATLAADLPQATEAVNPFAEVEAQVGFDVKDPGESLPEGYVLASVTVHQATRSVCLQYRYPAPGGDSLLLIAQGLLELTSPLELLPDLPDYLALSDEVSIGGAENSFHVAGWRRSAWACTEIAEAEQTPFSYAVAPWFTWQVDQVQFDLYSASGGCDVPGGLTSLDLLRLAESLTGESTHPAGELDPDCLHSAAEAAELAGFAVKEPGYLPPEVSFYYAVYQPAPAPGITLLYIHEQHRDTGRFFQVTQYQEAPAFFLTSCAEAGSNTCEVIQVGDTPVVYQSIEASDQLDWQADGYFFSLFRSAGEPGKDYKDELLKVAGSMK